MAIQTATQTLNFTSVALKLSTSSTGTCFFQVTVNNPSLFVRCMLNVRNTTNDNESLIAISHTYTTSQNYGFNVNDLKLKKYKNRISFTVTLYQKTTATSTNYQLLSGTFSNCSYVQYNTNISPIVVSQFNTIRCNNAGNTNILGGQYALASGTIELVPEIQTNEISNAKIEVAELLSSNKVYSLSLPTTSTQSFSFSKIIGNNSLITGNDYNFTLYLSFKDTSRTGTNVIKTVQLTSKIVREKALLHLSGCKNGGVAIGKFSSATENAVFYPIENEDGTYEQGYESGGPLFEVDKTHRSIFSGGIQGVTNYSSGEVTTGGTWIDGKPIYRYVRWHNETFNVGEANYVEGPSDVDVMIELKGMLKNSNGWFALPYIDTLSTGNAGRAIGLSYRGAQNDIRIYLGSAYTDVKTTVIIAYYTKTTD